MSKPIEIRDDEFRRGGAADAGGAKLVSIAEALRAQETQGGRAEHFHQLLDVLPAAVYTTDAEGRITYYNDAAADLWGHRPALGSAEWCGSWKLYWPDGRPMAHGGCPMATALKEKRQVRGLEAVAERPDGVRVPFLACPTPLYDDAGQLTGGVNMLIDISERKRAEEEQSLLIRELHHRVKNTLATVQAIMGSTAHTADTVEDFKTAMIGRIGSLAKTHLLLADEAHTASLCDLLHKELDAFDDGSEGRVVVRGPPVELSTQLAVSLGMALHELTTNAAKFGALSVHGGKVTALWRVTVGADHRTLDFDWVETGGPPVAPPARHGFGTRLLETVLPGQIRARTDIDYAPHGVCVHYTVPLPAQD
jgi:PAS domain S-box-containing protein